MPTSSFAKSIKIAVGLERANESVAKLDEAVKATVELHRVSEEITKTMKNTVIEQQALIETQKHQINNIKAIQQANLTIGNVSKGSLVIADKMTKSSEREADLIKNVISKAWSDIDKTLAQKNLKHADELNFVNREGDSLVNNLKTYDGIRNNVRDISTATENYLRHTLNIYEALRQTNESAREFNAVNYRIYGSQLDITDEAYRSAAAYGMMNQQVVSAYAALGANRLTNNINDFRQLAMQAVATGNATQIGIDVIVKFQKAVMSTTGSLGQTSSQLEKTIGHMRHFGLSTAETTSLLAAHASKLLELTTYYGELAVTITDAEMRLASWAKDLGGGSELVDKMGKSLSDIDPLQLRIMAQMLKVNVAELDTAAGKTQLFAAMSKKAYETISANAGKSKEQQFLALSSTMGMYGKQGEAAIQMARQAKAAGKTMEEMVSSLKKVNEYTDRIARGEVGFLEEFRTSINTIPDALQYITNKVWNTFQVLWNAVAPVALLVLKVVSAVVGFIDMLVGKINDFLTALGPVGTGIKYILGGLLLVLPVMLVFGKAIMWVGAALGILSGWAMKLLAFIPGLTAGMTTLGAAFMNGLRMLAPYSATIFALGALFAGVGVAAWGLATAVEKLTAVGARGVLYLGLITAAIIGLGIAFAHIGKIAAAGAPGLLAMGAAFAGIGVAAYGISTLITTIGNNWQAALAAGGLLVGVILAMGAAIGVLAGVGVVATGPILALGAALIMVGAAAYLTGLSLGLIVDALNKLTVGSVIGLAVMAGGLFVAARLLATANRPLQGAAFDLVANAAMLLGASLTLAAAAAPFILGSAAIATGSVMLLVGATMLRTAAALLSPAATALGNATPELMKSSMKLTMASAQFKVAMDGSFLKSSAILLGSAAMILAGAALLAVGSPILSVAAGTFLVAAKLLVTAAPIFDKAVNSLVKPSAKLLVTASILLASSGVLLAGGTMLLMASVAVGVASAVLLVSGIALLAGSVMIGVAVGVLNVAGAGMITAAALLTAGSVAVGLAAIPIGVAAVAIGVAGLLIWAASKPVQWGAANLKEAGADFLEAGKSLAAAGPMLAAGIAAVDSGTDGITRIGLSIWAGSKSFGKGAQELRAAIVPAAEAANMLASGLNGIDVALAKPYANMFTAFSESLSAASEPMMAMLDDVATRMASYSTEIEGSSTKIGKSFGNAGASGEKAQNAQQSSPVSRDKAAMLSPETVAANVDSDKKNRLLENQVSLLTAIATSLAELAKNGIPAGGGKDNTELLTQIRDALGSVASHRLDNLAGHMTDWGHS